MYEVSIHATLAGGDFPGFPLRRGRRVSIHATLAGGDGSCRCGKDQLKLFLSTPPSRVATNSEAGHTGRV